MGLFSRRKQEPPAERPAYVPSSAEWTGRPLKLRAAPTLENLPFFAEEIRKTIGRVSGVEVAIEPEALPVIDRIMQGWVDDGLGSDTMAETCWGMGCFLGEVMVRHAGGRWVETPDDLMPMMGFPFLIALGEKNTANPLARPFKLMRTAGADTLHGFYVTMTNEAQRGS